jgi:hypothetical protein
MAGQAGRLVEPFPELILRVEPAHREAYVDLGFGGPEGLDPASWPLAEEALRAWAEGQGIDDTQLSLKPEDLGVRITYLASGPPNATSPPECDFAMPFAFWSRTRRSAVSRCGSSLWGPFQRRGATE